VRGSGGLLTRDALGAGGCSHRGGHARRDPLVEDAGHHVVRAQVGTHHGGQGVRGGQLIPSVIAVARTSNAPRKTPGNGQHVC